jgi:multiple antibiotic resistance protein
VDLIRPFLLAFIPLFVAIDAFGVLPIFLSMTAHLSEQERTRTFRQAILAAGCIGVGFMLLGKALFLYLGITEADFQIAGGTLLFCLSLTDLLFEERTRRFPSDTMGVVPLAMPLMVGPAVLTTSVVLLESQGFWLTITAFLVNLGIVGAALWSAERIMAVVGRGTLNVLGKVVNLLLAAIGVMMVRLGLQALLGTS